MCDLEEQDALLKQLIQQVVENNDGSPEQSQALDGLLRLIPSLTGIYRHSNYPEAWNLALEGISIYQESVSGHNFCSFVNKFNARFRQNINDVNPAIVRKNYVTWFNKIVNYKVCDLQRQQRNPPLSLDRPIKQDEGNTTFGEILPDSRTLGGLESLIEGKQQQKKQRKALILELYIEQDPEGKLQNCYYKDKSNNEFRECNCQLLFKELCLTNPSEKVTIREGEEEITYSPEKRVRVADIAQKFGIPYISISSRLLPRCQKLIRDISQEIENNFDKYVKRLIGE